MHIFHALFTHAQGGLGAAYVNDTAALVSKKHRVTALVHQNSPYREEIGRHTAAIYGFKPTGFYDIFTAWKIRRLLKALRPDIILAHNARAVALMRFAARGSGIAVCGISHSYKTARMVHADALIVLTQHMKKNFIDAGYPESKLWVIPNLMHLPEKPVPHDRGSPPVIGALGRFTGEKGFADMLDALALLKEKNIEYVARIGGDGPELPNLKRQAESLGLTEHIKWIGWVKDKAAFYGGLDAMCMPSREDSFPLVVLESLAYGVPLAATDAPGPADMLTDSVDGLIVPRANAQAMAEALQRLVKEPQLAMNIAAMGWQTIQKYDFTAVAQQWDDALSEITATIPRRRAA